MPCGPLRLGLLLWLALAGLLHGDSPPVPPEAVPQAAPVSEPAPTEPAPPSPDTTEAKEKPAEPAFRPRTRHSLDWILSDGRRRFDAIEWVSRPDLATLNDLAAWPVERDYDFDGGLNINIRWWAGPQGDASTPVPNLPPRVYDLNLHASWRQRWADGITSEVTILPGLYTDFRTTPPDSFRVPGFAVGVFRVTDELHLVGGVQHLQRNRVKVLPIGGLLWEPDERLQWRLVFPEPKLAYRLSLKSDVWIYARGEYGGGTWAMKDDFGRAEHVEYSDLRAAVGFEWGGLTKTVCSKTPLGTGFFEVGYVFDRRLNFTNGTPETGVPKGWMVALGCVW